MNASDALATLNGAEAAAPVDEWIAGGTRIWPLVRERAWWRLLARSGAASPPESTTARVGRAAGQLANGVLRSKILERRDEASARRHADVLFVGDNVSRIPRPCGSYDRYCEPVMELLRARGVSSTLLEPHHRHPGRRCTPSRRIQLELDVARVRAARDASTVALPGHEAALAALDGVVTIEEISRWSLILHRQATVFSRYLERTSPRLGVYVDLNHQTMAFALACHRRGLRCVELQHGVQDEHHWAAAQWTRVPLGGFELLPDRWWVWTEDDAEVIRRWAGTTEDAPHGALVGGHPWLERWRSGRDGVEADVAPVRRRLVEHGNSRHALVTLQRGFTEQVLAAMPPPDAGIRWWLRPHPTSGPAELAAVNAWLAHRADAALADGAPLYGWLVACDVHVTHSSATAFEAALLGRGTVVVDPEGVRVHQALVRAGAVVFAPAADLPDAVAEGWHAGTFRAGDPVDGISQLIAMM